MRKLVVAIVVVLLLLVAADRAAAFVVSRQATDRLAAQGAEDPHVSVQGFPVLTDLLRRSVPAAHVTAGSLDVAGGTLRHVDAELHDVRLSGSDRSSSQQVTSGRLDATALVSWAQVEQAAGLPAGALSAQGDRVRVKVQLPVAGVDVAVSALADVAVDGRDVVITPERVSVGGSGELAASLADAVKRRATYRAPVPDLPQGIELAGVAVTQPGVRVHVTGTDVTLGSTS
ncbi:MAG: LmeA family phospholipid-binding protein [Motilibacteraceae bacterium]